MLRAATLLGLAGVLLTAACAPGPSKDEQAAQAKAALDKAMDPAFQTAFGGPAPQPHEIARNGQNATLLYSPQRLTDLGDGRLALVSTAQWPDGCPACGGAVAVHYLQRTGMNFSVTGAWYDLGPSGVFGEAPEARVRDGVLPHVAVQAEVSHRQEGCEITQASLYELLPSGPALRAKDIVIVRNNIPMGAMRSSPQADYYGNILPDKPGERFKVHYHGTTEGDVFYAPGAGGMWAKQPGGIRLPDC